MEITQRILDELKRKKLKQSDLAKFLAIGQGQISTWKAHETDPPTRHLSAIASFLGVTTDWLLTGNDPRSPLSFAPNGISIVHSTNSGTVSQHNPVHIPVAETSPETCELLRIFNALSPKSRHDLMGMAFSLEKGESQ